MRLLFPALRRGAQAALLAACGFGALAGAPAFSAAAPDGYPNRAIKFIVPYAPGGLPDTVARITAQRLSERLGSSVVVDNKPGANGVVAAQTLMASPADGYSFLVTDGSMMSINPFLYKDLSYDPKRDFMPVSLVATSPLFLAAHPSFPANTFQEFIDLIKSKPGEFNYGSSGIGSSHHLTMEALKAAQKLQIDHVPYRGSGQSVPALIGNQVPVVFSALPSLVGFVEKGQAKLLAVNSEKRYGLAPDVPAISELVPGFDFAPTVGILARTGTPEGAIELISKNVAEIVKMPAVIESMRNLGIDPVGGLPDAYAKAIEDESTRYAKAIAAAGIKAD